MAHQEHLKILKAGVGTWNDWRLKSGVFYPDLNHADLSGVDLRGADLNRVNFNYTDLSRANLSNASLYNADLGGADLSGAKLNNASLQSANLGGSAMPPRPDKPTTRYYADLSRADLSSACLVSANLGGASLDSTFFTEAELGNTIFGFTSLKTAKGLETCVHKSPSAIDYYTLRESGHLPDVFLRGCGLPDEFIHYLPSFWNEPFQFYSCFISYSHADKPFARRLHDSLQGRGIRCWLDEHQLLPGDQIHRAIDEAVRLWDKVILCCSKTSLNSWWVDKEIQKALMKEEQLWKERGKEVLAIIPLNLDGHVLDKQWQDWKKQHLNARLAADFTGWEKDNAKFEAPFDRVVKALRADAGARERPPKPLL